MAKTQKILLSGVAGTGKTSLLKNLKNAFVISRDGKDFTLPIPHVVYREFSGVLDMIEGYEYEQDIINPKTNEVTVELVQVEGMITKLDKYREKFGHFPDTIALDSVSKLANDIIEKGNTDFENFETHAYIKKDLGLLNKFITEYLAPRCSTLVLINHLVNKDGKFIQTGSGNFKDKGGFYAEVDEAITLVNQTDKKRKVYTRGEKYQARTLLDVPTEMPIPFIDPFNPDKCDEVTEEHFDLQSYITLMHESVTESAEWEL